MMTILNNRGDSKLISLTPEQRARVDAWIFEERVKNEEVARRCAQEFNLQLHESSVARYRRAEAERRNLDGLVKQAMADEPREGDSYERVLRKMSNTALALAEGPL